MSDLAELAAAAKEARAQTQLAIQVVLKQYGPSSPSLPFELERIVNRAHAAGLAEGRSEREALDSALGRAILVEKMKLGERVWSAHPDIADRVPGKYLVALDDAVAAIGRLFDQWLAAHPTPPDSIDDTQRAALVAEINAVENPHYPHDGIAAAGYENARADLIALLNTLPAAPTIDSAWDGRERRRTRECGCKADTELAMASGCAVCGHRDHSRAGCRTLVLADALLHRGETGT